MGNYLNWDLLDWRIFRIKSGTEGVGQVPFGIVHLNISLVCIETDTVLIIHFGCLTYISTILPFLRLTCITLLSGNMYLRQL